jgi:hypothetical protein
MTSNGLIKPIESQKLHEEVFDLNDAWEAQDGFENEAFPSKMIEVSPGISQPMSDSTYRPKLVTGDRPQNWRSSYNINLRRSSTPPSPKPRARIKDDGGAWEAEFESHFSAKLLPNPSQDNSSSDETSSLDFDIPRFRSQVIFVKRKLLNAFKSGDVIAGERHFDFLVRMQLNIPSSLDRLHAYCRPCWLAMLELYVVHGEYDKLQTFMDKLETTFGLFQADRALMTLRFLYSRNFLSQARSFWDEAVHSNILDERAYADVSQWLLDKKLYKDAKFILHSALIRSQTDPKFVLSVYYYDAAIKFCISQGERETMLEMLQSIKSTLPFGLGFQSFVSWLQTVNNLVFDRIMENSRNQKSKNHSQLPASMDQLLEVQSQIFQDISFAIESLSIGFSDEIRNETIRQKILQTKNLADMAIISSQYDSDIGQHILKYMIDSLMLHHNMEDIQKLIKQPSIVFGVDEGQTIISLIATTDIQKHITSWIEKLLTMPAYREAEAGLKIESKHLTTTTTTTSSSSSSSIHHIDIPRASLSLCHLLKIDSTPLKLYETYFLSRGIIPPPQTFARIILHVLELLDPYYELNPSRGGKVERFMEDDEVSDFRFAVRHVLATIYDKSTLTLPDDSHYPYAILKKLQRYGFMSEAKDFTHFCLYRLSSKSLPGIIALRMIQFGIHGEDWEAVNQFWKFAEERDITNNLLLTKIYAQCLERQEPPSLVEARVFIAGILNHTLPCSEEIYFEILAMMRKMGANHFDVSVFWALERLRRAYRYPLSQKIISRIVKTLLKRGLHYIRSEDMKQKLIVELKPFTEKNLHISPRMINNFQTIFDQWYSVFKDAVPQKACHIKPLLMTKAKERYLKPLNIPSL